MEIVKIKLTTDKVSKLFEQVRAIEEYIPSFYGNFTEEDKRVQKVLESFMNKIGYTGKVDVSNRRLVAGNQGETRMISTFFINKGICTVFAIKTEDFQVELTYNKKHNAIELWWLEINNRSTGTGTEMMNELLDAIDEMNEKLYLTPVPFVQDGNVRTKKQYHQKYMRLRAWYESFGLESIKQSPSLLYTS